MDMMKDKKPKQELSLIYFSSCPNYEPIKKMLQEIGLICGDIEFINPFHYQRTLFLWLQEFLKNKEKAKFLYDKEFCRMWEFYLSSCSSSFRFRDLVVFQMQIIKNFSALPSYRRDYMYSNI